VAADTGVAVEAIGECILPTAETTSNLDWNNIVRSPLVKTIRGNDHAEQPTQAGRARDTNDPNCRLKRRTLQEIVDVIRTIEERLSTLEAKGQLRPSAEMELPNRK
jgi:hypothetical protein